MFVCVCECVFRTRTRRLTYTQTDHLFKRTKIEKLFNLKQNAQPATTTCCALSLPSHHTLIIKIFLNLLVVTLKFEWIFVCVLILACNKKLQAFKHFYIFLNTNTKPVQTFYVKTKQKKIKCNLNVRMLNQTATVKYPLKIQQNVVIRMCLCTH